MRRPRFRAPFRVRLTLGFAGAMIVLFGGLALLLHTLVENSLDQALDRSLRTQANDLASLVAGKFQVPQLPESDGTFAQLLDPQTGAVLVATPGHGAPLLTVAQVRSVDRRQVPRDVGSRQRVLAEPVATRLPGVLVVGLSLSERNGTLTELSAILFAGGPALLLLTRVQEALVREHAFVAEAGHELRTPLAVLKLELELALSSDISREELQDRVRSAAEEVDRLTRIANDLLVIARAEQGRLPLQCREMEVDPMLAGLASRFTSAAQALDRTVRASGSGLTARADPAWLEQALNNLISNALRYGGGPVTLHAVRAGESVEFHVMDSGPGFEDDFLSRAFERFSRSDPSRWGVGAGLGLAIVRVVAEAHGGSACAANRDEGGADVWVALPVR